MENPSIRLMEVLREIHAFRAPLHTFFYCNESFGSDPQNIVYTGTGTNVVMFLGCPCRSKFRAGGRRGPYPARHACSGRVPCSGSCGVIVVSQAILRISHLEILH